MTSRTPRKLSREHFAFARALAQGVDARVAWERYLRYEGERGDFRQVKTLIGWIRQEFAAAARREAKFGTARLVLIDPARLTTDGTPAPPSLEDFAAACGMEDFSEAEQLEAYREAHGDSMRKGQRRERLVRAQLQALHWLEDLAAQDPGPGDSVHAWFAPVLAQRLEVAGLPTLFALATRIHGMGSAWHAAIPAIGRVKGESVREWITAHQATIGVRIGAHAAMRLSTIDRSELAAVVPAGAALVPLEKFVPPGALDGSAGRYRAPRELCMLAADNDHQAICAWLNSKRSGPEGTLSHTQRAYRKEGERLLLWAVLERRKALSSLNAEDAQAYAAFLLAPPSHWCGERHHQRWSPMWRPIEGALSPAALAQSVTILRNLYQYLNSQSYLHGNPFESVALPAVARRKPGDGRSIPRDAMAQLLDLLAAEPPSTAARARDVLALRWLYATGLRRSEMVAAVCGDLDHIEYADARGRPAHGWLQRVTGKGTKMREVPVPAELVDALSHALVAAGRDADPRAPDNAAVPVLFTGAAHSIRPMTAQMLYKRIKDLFGQAAAVLDRIDAPAAERLRQASAHWLRHASTSHAVNAAPGGIAVAPHIVQGNLGHSSLDTTMGYLTTERDTRLRSMQEYWNGTTTRQP